MTSNRFETIKAERTHFPALQNSVYLASAATGLVPDYVYTALRRYADDRLLVGGDSVWEGGCGSLTMMNKSREWLGRMLNCSADDIAFAMNTSHALSLFTANIPVRPGGNVVIPANCYNSSKFAWQIRQWEGIEIRYAEVVDGQVTPEAIFRCVDQNTLAVQCSYVEAETGYLLDAETIGKFCRQRGIWFILDAAQAAGVLDIDVQRICVDVLAFADYKWMMNYAGTGVAYIRKEAREQLKLRAAGWMSDAERFYEDAEVLSLRQDCGCFDIGYPNMPVICGMGLVAKRYCELGRQEIQKYVFSLRDYLCARLEAVGARLQLNFPAERKSQIVCMLVDPEKVISDEQMREKGIMCNVREIDERTGMRIVRMGLHYYNNKTDIDRFIEVL